MYAGEIVEMASVEQIFDAPAHPYTRALMGCRPEVVPHGKPLTAIPGQVPRPGQWADGCRFAPRCALAEQACRSPVSLDAWRQGAHCARCVRGGRQ